LLALLDESPQSFVGEDVELSLMLLSNYSSTTNLSRDTKDASDAYKKLGVLSHIAKKVRDYKVSRFGGSSPSRARVTYDNSSPEVLAATDFVRKFIDKAEERGVLTYKLQMNNKPIPKRIHARKHAKIYINVPQLGSHFKEDVTATFGSAQRQSTKSVCNFRPSFYGTIRGFVLFR
jgi:hypothetical protein